MKTEELVYKIEEYLNKSFLVEKRYREKRIVNSPNLDVERRVFIEKESERIRK